MSLLTKEELRIGNWVAYPMAGHQQIKDGNEIDLIEENTPNPILLTPEILIKCGFEERFKNSRNSWRHFVLKNNWHISQWIKDEKVAGFEEKGLCYWGDEYIPIKYLHQLQNLYYALTEKELEIKL